MYFHLISSNHWSEWSEMNNVLSSYLLKSSPSGFSLGFWLCSPFPKNWEIMVKPHLKNFLKTSHQVGRGASSKLFRVWVGASSKRLTGGGMSPSVHQGEPWHWMSSQGMIAIYYSYQNLLVSLRSLVSLIYIIFTYF